MHHSKSVLGAIAMNRSAAPTELDWDDECENQ
jgi:hypothetical protein